MNIDTSTIWWSLLFGSIGFGYFMYGRKQKRPVPLVCGIALMIFPYVVSNNWLMVVTGGVLMAIPYFVKL